MRVLDVGFLKLVNSNILKKFYFNKYNIKVFILYV